MITTDLSTKQAILHILKSVKDPEIPTISIVDLGLVDEIQEDLPLVEIIPTFSSCGAMRFIQMEAELILKNSGFPNAKVVINPVKSWTSARISEQGRADLLLFGISPPPIKTTEIINFNEKAICPHCLSENTNMVSPFGPALCRSIHKCYDCLETFEQFKSI